MSNVYLIVNRFFSDAKHTVGTLTIMDNNTPVCILKTLELPWKDNQRNISCIPLGTYEATTEIHRDRGWVIRINNVPGRSGILIHIGNYIKDIEGCILVGLYHNDFDGDGIQNVAYSRISMETLRNYLKNQNLVKIVIV